MFQTDYKNTYPYMRGVLEYTREYTVKERYCEDFLNIKIFNFTNNTELFVNTVTVKDAVLE